MSTNKKFAHELVAATAKELAGTFYEELAGKSDDFYHYYPSQKLFISREWKRFIETARKTLSVMLGQSSTPEPQKEIIFDALIKHASLPGNTPKAQADQFVQQGSLH